MSFLTITLAEWVFFITLKIFLLKFAGILGNLQNRSNNLAICNPHHAVHRVAILTIIP